MSDIKGMIIKSVVYLQLEKYILLLNFQRSIEQLHIEQSKCVSLGYYLLSCLPTLNSNLQMMDVYYRLILVYEYNSSFQLLLEISVQVR